MYSVALQEKRDQGSVSAGSQLDSVISRRMNAHIIVKMRICRVKMRDRINVI
jgi:hypothetical protein